MNGVKTAAAGAPTWAKAALIALPLFAALSAGAVEVQFGQANKHIPGGEQHDEAWKTYHRIRQFNRATLAVSIVAAAAAAASIVIATANRSDASSPTA